MKAYSADQADIDEICAINAQLAERDEFGQVFIVLDDGNTKNNNLVDTYVQDGPGDYRYLTPDALESYTNAHADSDKAHPADPVRYLLVNKKQKVRVTSDGVEQIGGLGNEDGRYILYRITGNDPLQVHVPASK